VIALTAEELHFLAAAHGIETVPGLGPLPLDPADGESLRLMRGTAERSLRARGLIGAPEIASLLEPVGDPEWFATAVRPDETARAWCRRGPRATELARLAPTDYALTALEPAGIRARIADYLALHGDDASQDDPETPDEERVRALLAPPAWVGEATRAVHGDIVALQWIDPGDGSSVWLVGGGNPVQVTRTGRAAVLARLS
jgi:hypothetical protein